MGKGSFAEGLKNPRKECCVLGQQGHSLGSGVKSAPTHMPFSTGTQQSEPEKKHVWASGLPPMERTCHLDLTHTPHSHLPCPPLPTLAGRHRKAQQVEQTRAAGGRRGEGPQVPVQRAASSSRLPFCLSESCSPKGSSPREPRQPLLNLYHRVSRISSGISLISLLFFLKFLLLGS